MAIFSRIEVRSSSSMFKQLLTGLTIPQQYVCVALEELTPALSVRLAGKGTDLDVKHSHLFLGYKPLIIAFIFGEESNEMLSEVQMNFLHGETVVAELLLKKIASRKIGNKNVVFFEGVKATHKFLNSLQQFVNNQREKFREVKDPNNIALEGSLYDMVRVAYSIPRLISVITVSDGTGLNMFPTDLHGKISDQFYISSLRIKGKANEQVEQTGKIVLSNVDASEFRNVYSLGKNHMRELRPMTEFNLSGELSEAFKFPLPPSTLEYKELKRIDSFDHGVHRIHTYEIVNAKKLRQGSTLSHIHQYYAQWRLKNNMKTEMLLR